MQKIWMVLKVIEVRLRFIAVLVVTFLGIVYWDTIVNYWEKWTRPAAAASAGVLKDEEYFCPMDPGVIRDRPDPGGKTPQCPICGMPLSLRKKGEKEKLPPGVTSRVQLSPERVQLAGVQTVAVTYRPMTLSTVAVGNVAYDESRLSRITSRVGGYVEKLDVDRTFVPVEKGQSLAEIYSPELFATSQELLLAARRGNGSEELVRNARERLKLLGVADEEIDAMIRSGKASPRLTLRAPRGGQVIGKQIVAGMKVEEGMTLLEIADLSAVWIEADVFEKDIGNLHVGQAVDATVEAISGRTFNGKIAAIYAQLSTETRTNRVRFEVNNDSGRLRPGMFATVRIDTPITQMKQFADVARDGQVPAVPESAVIDTGVQKIVYVESKPGVFEGVEVEIGPQIGGYYPVVKGLEPGQSIVAAGSFLIDAETRLKPIAVAYTGTSGGQKSESPQTTVTTAAKAAEIPASALKNIEKLPAKDQPLAKEQKMCPITDQPLGSMGVPVAVALDGQKVFLCCSGCVDEAKKNAEKTLKKVAELKHK
jgi:multidrug efflux pump subunit AcrA (membrane-fusion protein)